MKKGTLDDSVDQRIHVLDGTPDTEVLETVEAVDLLGVGAAVVET